MSDVFSDHQRVGAAIASVVDAIGKQNFYSTVLETLGRHIDCELAGY